MNDKRKRISHMNPTIHSILDNLAEDSMPPDRVDLWPEIHSRLAANKPDWRRKDLFRNKRILFPALAAIIILAVMGFFMSGHITNVSAEQILERAAAAESANQIAVGIKHFRKLSVSFPGESGSYQTASSSINDSYYDYQMGRIRWVYTDLNTGKVLDAYSYDGTYTLSADQEWLAHPTGDILPIIRTQVNNDYLASMVRDGAKTSDKQIYLMNLDDPQVELVGKERWSDGREVYVLRSHWAPKEGDPSSTEGMGQRTSIMLFDVQTYQLLETREMMVKDGKEILAYSSTYLIDELLPADSYVPWDMSDLPGVKIVDKP